MLYFDGIKLKQLRYIVLGTVLIQSWVGVSARKLSVIILSYCIQLLQPPSRRDVTVMKI